MNRYEIARRLIRESDLIRTLIRAGREVPLAMRVAHTRTNREYDRCS